MAGRAVAVAAIIFIALGGYFLWRQFVGTPPLPSGNAVREMIVIEDGKVVGTVDDPALLQDVHGVSREEIDTATELDHNGSKVLKRAGQREVKEIFVTDGVRHSVPLNEILSGGPAPDGIPPIDNPKFVTIEAAQDFLPDDELGIAFSLNGVDRFYPYQVLVWHEIVNDTLGGQRVLVTYCPLCLSGVVYDPLVDGERVEFGTSGRLWQSNLVMYDRQTDSLWSQVLGEAIVGPQTGTRLTILSSDVATFGAWRKEFPEGEVLSRDTGFRRLYGTDPYGNYYTTPGTRFPVRTVDRRLPDKELVLGLLVDGQAKAYPVAAVKQKGSVKDEFAGRTIVAEHDTSLDVVRLFIIEEDGARERVDPLPNFWFSWVAAYPDTELYK